jgi:hypothetical protein
MVKVKCSGCGATTGSGKIFYQCDACGDWWCSDCAIASFIRFYECSACGRWWCSSCGSKEGDKCICGRGYLREPK